MSLHHSEPIASRVPAVTVIIPAYGVNAYIGEAIDSVFAQSYHDYEIVVVNDGAPAQETADLKAILDTYNGRVGYLERVNGGQGAARNTAMRVSRSEFVAFLDGDDIWMPDFLGSQMALFERDNDLALAYSDALIFGETVTAGSTYMERDPSIGEVTLESLLAGRCNVTMSTIVARREKLIEAGWFDETLRYCEDFDLWFRMAYQDMRITYQPVALTYRRVRGDALSANDIKLNQVAISVLERFERDHKLSVEEHSAWESNINKLRFLTSLAEAKQKIRLRKYRAAARQLESLSPEYLYGKIRVARRLLRFAPSLFHAAYLSLLSFYEFRERWHVKRVGDIVQTAESAASSPEAPLEPSRFTTDGALSAASEQSRS